MKEEIPAKKSREESEATGRRKRPRGESGRGSVKPVAVKCLVVILALLLVLGGGASHVASAERKRVEGVAGGNCAACHGDGKVLPSGHADTKSMTLQDCTKCHKDGKLSGRLLLGHVHLLSGMMCSGCHGDAKPQKPPKTAQCLSCHPEGKLAAKTAGLEPNPHTPPPHAPSVDCDLCHHQHTKSGNYCAQCHPWDFKVP